MKHVASIFCAVFLCTTVCIAQINFQDITTTANLEKSLHGTVSLGDIDGDGDLDAFVTGRDPVSRKSTLYTNDGLGNFTEVTGTPFAIYEFTFTGFADIDSDGDLDLLHTGWDNAPTPHSDLYFNDGTGVFTLDPTANIIPTSGGYFEFTDVNNDGHLDLLIAGSTEVGFSFVPHTTLYLNNGIGGFSEVVSAPFEDVSSVGLAFGDLDNDGDQDVIVAGQNNSGTKSTKLYSNDGFGNFTLVTGTPFDAISQAHISIADTDNDGDLDVLISGSDASFASLCKLYLNDGAANFTHLASTPFSNVRLASQKFADFDMDGDLDLLSVGFVGGATSAGEVFENQGSNNFVLVGTLTPAYRVRMDIGDIDGDLDLDALVVGIAAGDKTRVYENLHHNCPAGNIQVLPKAFLQGALSGATMTNTLGTSGLLPTTSPYTDAKVANAHILADMSDWVEVQIRDAATGNTVLDAQSALLKPNGEIVDRDGKSPLLFCQPAGNYRVAIKHRNHLGVMTGAAITFN